MYSIMLNIIAAENSNKLHMQNVRFNQSQPRNLLHKQHHQSVLTKNQKHFPQFKFSSVKTPNARMFIKFNGKFSRWEELVRDFR